MTVPTVQEKLRNAGAFRDAGFISGVQGATPKYARNQGQLDNGFQEHLARIFINTSDTKALEKRLSAAQGKGPQFAEALKRIYGNGYVDFIMQSIQTGLQEKLDLSENLSDGYVAYYLGQAPTTLSCSGVFLNSMQDDQALSFVELYKEVLRGTKLAEHGETARFRFDSFLYTGTISNLQWGLSAGNELVCPFSFSFLVKTQDLIQSPYFVPTTLESAPDNMTQHADAVGPKVSFQKVTFSAPPAAKLPAAKETASPTADAGSVARKGALEALARQGAPDVVAQVISLIPGR